MVKTAQTSAERQKLTDQWVIYATDEYQKMEKKTGTSFPKLACDIRKYRDVWNCVRDRVICLEKNWLKNKYQKCLEDETRKKAETIVKLETNLN